MPTFVLLWILTAVTVVTAIVSRRLEWPDKKRLSNGKLMVVLVVLITAAAITSTLVKAKDSFASNDGTPIGKHPTGSSPTQPAPKPILTRQLSGSTIVVSSSANGVNTMYSIDTETGTGRALAMTSGSPGESQPKSPVISPDRRTLIYLDAPLNQDNYGTAKIVSVHGQPVELFGPTSFCGMSTRPAFSPNGSELAVICANRISGIASLVIVDLHGDLLKVLLRDRALVGSPTWADDGRVIFMRRAGATYDHLWSVVPARPTATLHQLTRFQGWDSAPDWSPKFGLVFTRGKDEKAGGAIICLIDRHLQVVKRTGALAATWSPNGGSIAFLTRTEQGRLALRTIDRQGGDVSNVVVPNQGSAGPPAWGSR